MKRSASCIAGLLLMSHNAHASPCEIRTRTNLCVGSALAWDLAATLPVLVQHTPSVLMKSLMVSSSSQDAASLLCPTASSANALGEYSCPTRDLGASDLRNRPPISAQAGCEQNRHATVGNACTAQLVDDWWDAARKVTLDF